MEQCQYVCIKIDNIPPEIIDEYDLTNKLANDGHVMSKSGKECTACRKQEY